MAHWSFAAFLALACHLLFPAQFHLFLVVGVVAAAVKEFWYDLRYETDDAAGSGGVTGSIEDFSFYCLGLLIAVILTLL